MKILNNELISIDENDIIDGVVTIPLNVNTILDHVFNNLPSITKVIGLGVTTIGNYNFYECNALTSVDFPVVTTIGNYNFYECNALTSVDFPVVTTIGNCNFCYCNARTSVTFFNKKFKTKLIDGYLFVIKNKKTTKGIIIYTGYNFYSRVSNEINKENCYVAEKDNFFAHGNSIKKAIQDVQFKCIAEKLKKEPINADTIITVNYYRLVTGACELGVNSWIKQNNITKEEYRADELLPLLEKTNAYGVDKFKSLVNF